ncbi:MAG TPA: hypothetical protein VFA41_08365 [Ktedonobacteraceae bacterium]|jgi:hypothetical protein|nr:hypothetical protein [Ktedonobacteraceae bacterium]
MQNGPYEEYSTSIHSELEAMSIIDAPARDKDKGDIAYQLLLLQQRLASIEQLHAEELAEIRREIERLRRDFLYETNSRMRAISPSPSHRNE